MATCTLAIQGFSITSLQLAVQSCSGDIVRGVHAHSDEIEACMNIAGSWHFTGYMMC